MTKGRFADEFKEEAVKPGIERVDADGDAAKRLGISVQSLYKGGRCIAERKRSL